jgi:hypothetical protein
MKLTPQLLFLPLLNLALLSPAQEPPAYASLDEWARMKDIVPRHYICRRASGPVVVDGRLDDPAWQNAPWTEDFVDIEGAGKPLPRYRTRAKMLWDDEYLYVGAELEEPHVWATQTRHDSVIFTDPDFEVFIDPNGDSHDYYEFEMNALNTGWDLLLKKPYKDGGPALNSWDIAGLKTQVSVRGTINNPSDKDEGWTVEIAFPWKALAEYAGVPAPPRDGDQWRIDFSRVEWDVHVENGKYVKAAGKKEDNWVWSPQGVIDMHRPEQWAFLQFSTNTTKPAAFRPDPAFAAKRALQGLYYAQRSFREQAGRWARDLDELSKKTAFRSESIQIELKLRPDGYLASATALGPDGKPRLWHIRQDARIWAE